jgi:hypothetical protein
MLNIGCVSTVSDHAKSAYRNVKRGLSTGPGSTDTDALYAQVRVDDQRTVNNLSHELDVTREAEKLAKLEKQRDDLRRERSRTNANRVEVLMKEQKHRVELAKLEAIDRARLGDRIDNIERMADIHVDALELQQKRLQLDSEVSILDIKIDELQTSINKQQQTIDNLKNNDTKSRG